MIPLKSLVIYRNRPALVSGVEGEKIIIAVFDGDAAKVRGKDVEVIHPGPCTLKDLEVPVPQGNVREAWELLTETESGPSGTSLKELAELVYGVFNPVTALAAWELLREGVYFTGDVRAVRARPRPAVEEEEKKREEKRREAEDRAAFLEKLKKLKTASLDFSGEPGKPLFEELSGPDRRFLQDVEALARGRSDKSRTLKELGKSETAEEAHRLLLASGAWTIWENPHPGRFGLSRDSAKIVPPGPPEEERLDLTGFPAYAIDNPWSDDPDDAVSLETPTESSGSEGGSAHEGYILWVHIADPASSVLPGSPVDIEARDRGATLYLPEGASRMLSPEALPLFALGFGRQDLSGRGAVSPALSFKITLNADMTIKETEIFPSLVRVTRLTYAEADAFIAGEKESAGECGKTLAALSLLAERNIERRLDTGAVMIEFPEAHIQVNPGENRIDLEPVGAYRSAGMVRECMILAGEGAARWALQRKLPLPFISQEAGELPERRLEGLAGAWQLRRCMRPRNISAKPGVHWGLGLDEYAQVTSPLRRYMDMLCHQQIRALLRGQKPLEEDEILFKAAAAEAAATTVSRAEKVSRAHWMAVYLSIKRGSGSTEVWDGVVLDRKGNKGAVIIPALGLETQVSLRGNEEPNDKVNLRLLSVKIPEGETNFSIC